MSTKPEIEREEELNLNGAALTLAGLETLVDVLNRKGSVRVTNAGMSSVLDLAAALVSMAARDRESR